MAEFDVSAARKAGYSDDDILEHLTSTRKFDVTGAIDSGYSKTDVISHLSATPPAKVGGDAPAVAEAPSVGGFLRNVVGSGMGQVKNLANMVAHPIDTATNLAAIPGGAVIKASRALGAAPTPQGDKAMAGYDAFVSHVKDRYGSAEAAKKTLYEDPVGALMDISMLFGGTGAAARGAGAAADAAGMGRVAAAARTVAKGAAAADPVAVAGRASGNVISSGGRSLAEKAAVAVENANPVHQDMVSFGDLNGIPVSAGVRTGNRFVQGVQAVADHSPAGSVIARTAKEAEAAALTRVGDELAAKVHPDPISPLQAGTDVADALDTKIGAEHAAAGEHYDVIRELEADPANLERVAVRTKQVPMVNYNGKPTGHNWAETVMELVPLPVDMRAAKAALQPVYDRMMRQLPITQQRGSAGLKAIENILRGDDFAPASLVDTDLGTIKGIARGADLPELKNMSQALGAQAIPAIEEAVQAAVAKAKRTGRGGAGDEATAALREGRDATIRKYEAASVRDGLPNKGAEGRQVFDQAIWQKDAGVEKLRALAKQTPDEIPKLGRAALEDLLDEAKAEGGFDKGKSILARWERMGDETKAILYKHPQLIKDLDNFFLLAKKQGEQINPSGTAMVSSIIGGLTTLAAAPAIGAAGILGTGVLSKMMHSPSSMAALTDGMKIKAGQGAASVAAAAKILQQAKRSGADLPDDKIESLAAEFGKAQKHTPQLPTAVGQ